MAKEAMVKRMKETEEGMLKDLMKGMGKKKKGKMVKAEVIAEDKEGLEEGLKKGAELLDDGEMDDMDDSSSSEMSDKEAIAMMKKDPKMMAKVKKMLKKDK